MGDTCLLIACQDGTTNLRHLSSRALLATYKENSSCLRGLAPISLKQSSAGIHVGDAYLSVQKGRPSINIYYWSKDAPVYRCAMVEELTCIAVSRDGAFCFAGCGSGKLYTWDLVSGELLRVLQAHYKSCTTVDVSECGQYLVTGGADALVHVLDVASIVDQAAACDGGAATTRPIATFSGHSLPITKVMFTQGQTGFPRIVSCSLDHSVRWWDVASGRQLACATLPTGCSCMAFHSVHNVLYVGCIDSLVYMVDVNAVMSHCAANTTPYAVHGPDAHASTTSSSSATQPGSSAASQTGPGGPLTTVGSTRVLRGHTGVINDICCTLDGSLVVTAADDGLVRCWDSRTCLCTSTIEGTPAKAPVLSCSLLPTKPAVFTTSSTATGRAKDSKGSLPGQSHSVGGVGLPAVAPLKKHIQPISTDWSGSATGPLDREAVVTLVPTLHYDDAVLAPTAVALQLRTVHVALSLSSAHVQPVSAGRTHGVDGATNAS